MRKEIVKSLGINNENITMDFLITRVLMLSKTVKNNIYIYVFKNYVAICYF